MARVVAALRLDSIKGRILALAVVATLVPALGTAVLSYRQSRAALAANLEGELRSRGSQGAREVDLWIKERQYDVRVFTGSFEVSENLDRIRLAGPGGANARTRLREYLVGVHGRFTDYAELVVLDPEGRPVASSNDAGSTVEIPGEWLTRLSRGETVLGDPAPDPDLGRTAATLAAPIETADGRFLGVLAATVVFDAVGALLQGVAPGEGGSMELVDADGSLIATSEGGGTGGDFEPALVATLSGATGAVEYVDRTGTPVVGSWTAVPGSDWAVVAQVSSAEAYARVAELRSSALLLVGGLLIVLGGAAYLLGSVIVRPLERLTAGAGAVAAGDLTVDLPTAGRGEVAYLTQVFNGMVHRLRESRQELDERNRELERLAVTDLLTGLRNRRFLLNAFEQEIRRADRRERPFCVLMMDVDRFKHFNDTYGHAAGDQVLIGMGRVITDAIRDLDVAARYGGEEFIVLLPECDLENAMRAAERIRTRLAREPFEHGKVTISVGVAEFPMHGETPQAVISEADVALYEAKRLGRDQVCAAPRPDSSVDLEEVTARRAAAAKGKRS